MGDLAWYILIAFAPVLGGIAIGVWLGYSIWGHYKADVEAWEEWNSKRLETQAEETKKLRRRIP